jgi:GTP-binding protein
MIESDELNKEQSEQLVSAEAVAPSRRVIAIVGRPNVGKSALFNRIVGRRIAIVHEESGVTRDRISCEADWHGQRFELIDTGGIGLMRGETAGDVIIDNTRKQVDLAIQDAAVIILVVDATAGAIPLDREVADLLREGQKTVLVAANKCDEPVHDDLAAEFEQFGFPVYPISALHNRGVGDLVDAAAKELPEVDEDEREEPLRIAVVGRPNVGKSSYINRILCSERVIVSNIPGTTRDSVEIPFQVGRGPNARHYVLIDTAGVRKARKMKEAVDKFSVIRTEESIKRSDVVVLMLDAVEGPKRVDKKIAHAVDKARKGCVLLVNKWDLSGEITQRQYGKALREALPFMGHIPIVFASAVSGYNIRNTLEAVDYVADQVQMTVTTGLLNRIVQDAVQAVQPPVVGRRRLKIYYAVQVGTKPFRVRLFVNSTERLKPAYRSYLVRCMREALGLEGAPVVLQFRSHHRDS